MVSPAVRPTPTTLTRHDDSAHPHASQAGSSTSQAPPLSIMPTGGRTGLELALLLGTGVALGASLAANWSLLRREERRQRQRQQGEGGNEGVGGEGFEICK